MIPKKIYYCWFWWNQKNETIIKCIQSWKKYCPGYEIIEINENTFDINKNHFCKKAYEEKKWAFVSDYARLKTIYENWWIYFDTDLELIKNIDIFLDNIFFTCYEKKPIINFAAFWAIKWTAYNKKMLEQYNKLDYYKTIPNIWTDIYKLLSKEEKNDILVLNQEYFYPFDFDTKFTKKCIKANTYWIHWWETSWYPWYYKIIKKIWLLWIVPILGKIKNKILNK